MCHGLCYYDTTLSGGTLRMTQQQFDEGKRVVERWDQCFRAVAAEPRRQIITSLLDTPPTQSVSLPEGAMNPNLPADPETLRVKLHHNHLPMLAEGGYIEWESEPFEAFRGPQFEEVAAIFEALYSTASEIPESLVVGCQTLEQKRQTQ